MAIRISLGQVMSCCGLEPLWDETTGLVWEPGSLLNTMNKQMLFIKEVSTSDLESGCALFLASLPIYVDSRWLCTMIFCDWYSSSFLSQEWYSLNWYSMLFYSKFDTPWGSDLILLVIYTTSVNPAILMSSPSWVSIFDTSGSHCSFYPDSQLDFVHVHLVWFYCMCVCVPM